MKKIILLTFIILHPSILLTQWSQIASINTPQLNAVKFFNEWTGITVGQGGIWRSTNSGVNWTQVLAGVNLNSVSFPDNNTGYAVGDSGKVFKTTDAGNNWFQISSITTKNLYGVDFATINIGYTVGQDGVILRTGNGGATWVNQVNPIPQLLYAVLTFTPSAVCAVGTDIYEVFLTTGNSGINWTWTIYGGVHNLKNVAYIGSTKIEVVGTSGLIRRSTNYGGSWTQIPSGTTAVLNSISFPDSSTGFIAGNNGIILKSTNGGFNWSSQTSGTTYNLRAISFVNATIGWIVGQNGIVMRTGIPVGIIKILEMIPQEFKLYQNYPNPFNPNSKIKYQIAKNNQNVKILVFDIMGREIAQLVNQKQNAGTYEVDFDGSNYASGVYLYQLIVDESIIDTKKLILIK